MASFKEFLLSLDSDAGMRGKQFEHFVKWFLKNDPEWSTQVDQVWLWDEYPDSWGRDCGIDLVFKHKNGENWAVQAKCYAPTTSITKADVDSFISESNRDGIDKRLLIATTDLIGANARQVCDAQDKPVTRFLLSHFEDADIEYPATLDDLPKAKRKERPKPRDHQIEAIEAVASNFKDVDRGQLIMACGTGKTFTTLWIKEKLGVESTLVLLPSLGLLSQTLHEWTLAANEEFQVLCVCSDESVGKKGSDETVHSIADLAFPVTSNVSSIKDFLNNSGKKVIFSTYQSSPLIADAQSDQAVPAFDLTIADEAHRCAGKVSGDFSTILDGEKIRAKKRLFTTATPRTYSSSVKKAAEDRGVEVVGMDDEAVFGRQLFALNFGEAIKRGLLTDYQVVIIGVDDPTISAWIENRELLKADSDIEMDAESLAAQVGLLKAIKDYDLHRLISFHSRVSRAEEFSQDIHKVLGWAEDKHKPSGELVSDFVSGEMPTDKRRRKLTRLKELNNNQRGLLTNARCLSEGVDVPSLDGVAFIDPRSSQIDIIQAVGRAIRLSANKKTGTIILPVFIDNTDNPEQALEEGNFKPIWDVLNALKAHDDVLAEELNQIRTELGRKGGGKVNPKDFSKIAIDLPVNIDDSFGDRLRTVLVEQVTASWEFWYGLLVAYYDENKTSRVPHQFRTVNNLPLGRWIITQRNIKASLSKDRIEKLESFPDWSWDPYQDRWEQGYEFFKDYVKVNGNCSPPKDLRCDGFFDLKRWVTHQRSTKHKMPEDRIKKMEEIPGWVWSPYKDKWNESFKMLQEYVQENGNCLVPYEYKNKAGYELGVWLSAQRNRKKLSPERKALLEALPGWTWDIFKDKWNTNFDHLVDFANANGTTQVPTTFKLQNGFGLGGWLLEQKKLGKDAMNPERVEKLESLPGWTWDIVYTKIVKRVDSQSTKVKIYDRKHGELWDIGFEHLKKYLTSNSIKSIEKGFTLEDGFKLASWVSEQRSRRDRLSPRCVQLLESLPGWIWEKEDLWDFFYSRLISYVRANGTSLVPFRYTESDCKLGNWVAYQRENFKNLGSQRISKLEELPGWTWDPLGDQWRIAFDGLKLIAEQTGSAMITSRFKLDNGFQIGQWVRRQWRNKRSLEPYQIQMLESLPGWEWGPEG